MPGACPRYERVRPPRLRGRALQKLRRHVFAEQPICAECAKTLPWQLQRVSVQIDHITPLSQGGGDERGNLRGICAEHHAEKSARERWGEALRGSPPMAGHIFRDREPEPPEAGDFVGYGSGTSGVSRVQTPMAVKSPRLGEGKPIPGHTHAAAKLANRHSLLTTVEERDWNEREMSESREQRIERLKREHVAKLAKLKDEGQARVREVYDRHHNSCGEWDLQQQFRREEDRIRRQNEDAVSSPIGAPARAYRKHLGLPMSVDHARDALADMIESHRCSLTIRKSSSCASGSRPPAPSTASTCGRMLRRNCGMAVRCESCGASRLRRFSRSRLPRSRHTNSGMCLATWTRRAVEAGRLRARAYLP